MTSAISRLSYYVSNLITPNKDVTYFVHCPLSQTDAMDSVNSITRVDCNKQSSVTFRVEISQNFGEWDDGRVLETIPNWLQSNMFLKYTLHCKNKYFQLYCVCQIIITNYCKPMEYSCL